MVKPKRKVETKFTPNKKKFCDYFLKSGNATQSYLKVFNVSSKRTAEVLASRMLRDDKVAIYISEKSKELDAKATASIEEVQKFWADVLRKQEDFATLKDRLKASEYIAKTKGAFIDKIEHSVPSPININLKIDDNS